MFLMLFSENYNHCGAGYVQCIITRKRGKAQRDDRPPLLYRSRTFVPTYEYFVTKTTAVGWGPV